MLASAPVAATASLTVLNTGLPRCVVPPLPGVTPATTCASNGHPTIVPPCRHAGSGGQPGIDPLGIFPRIDDTELKGAIAARGDGAGHTGDVPGACPSGHAGPL